MKVVIHASYGGFNLSGEAVALGQKLSGDLKWGLYPFRSDDRNRASLVLIQVIETLGEDAGSNLKIVEVPDGVEWQIEEYDGNEWVAEKHRTWGRDE